MSERVERVALLCAGQGVEPPWLAPELVTRAAARPLVDALGDVTELDGMRLLVRGGPELARTEILQPALVTACLIAAAAIAEAGVVPSAVCGHSLGELTAWAAGGYISASEAIAAASLRGRLMAREAARNPGGMAVVSGDLDAVLAHGRAHGRLVIAAENSPTETVVSGDAAALAAIVATYRCRRLPVAGAWHSDAMADAVGELASALAAIPRVRAPVSFVCNHDGSVAQTDDLPALLAGQLVRPIRWIAAMRTLASLGITRYVVVGPGRLVRALIRANLGDVDVRIVDSERDLARVAA